MLDFKALELKVSDNYSFVGIERKEETLIFHLPKGFDEYDSSLNTFDKKRDLFFLFYRVFNKFKQICVENKNLIPRINDRDGIFKENEGKKIVIDSYQNQNIIYSKIDVLDGVLDIYDELKILSLVSRLGKSEVMDYGQLHRFLHRSIFLENNAIYLDYMTLPRYETHYDESDIIMMYCYIATEIKYQLSEQVSSEIKAFSEQFKRKYIGLEYSLFSENYYKQVINLLKDSLELIDRHTPIKDPDYWDFYNAIELFLFGEFSWTQDGEIWGIRNFHSIWESMCLTYLVKNTQSEFILYADPRSIITSEIKSKVENKSKDSILKIDQNIFHINNSNIYPDFILLVQDINPPDSGLFKHSLYPYYWDDYGYKTMIIYQSSTRQQEIKIAFEKQNKGEHTLEIIKDEKRRATAGKHYAYWDLDLSHDLSQELIGMMVQYNHLFYIAFHHKLFAIKDFMNFFDEKSYVLFCSLLRNDFDTSGKSIKPCLEKVYKKFIQFCLKRCFINIIDIKYNSFDYFLEPNRIEEIKRRSLRKQFVYEYLIQKSLEKEETRRFPEVEIRSEFWLPIYSPNSPTLIEGQKYLDGYVKLTGVNIMDVIKEYLNR